MIRPIVFNRDFYCSLCNNSSWHCINPSRARSPAWLTGATWLTDKWRPGFVSAETWTDPATVRSSARPGEFIWWYHNHSSTWPCSILYLLNQIQYLILTHFVLLIFARVYHTFTQNMMHFVAFCFWQEFVRFLISLISRKTSQTHDSCLNLSHIISICSVLSPLSHAWHYLCIIMISRSQLWTVLEKMQTCTCCICERFTASKQKMTDLQILWKKSINANCASNAY